MGCFSTRSQKATILTQVNNQKNSSTLESPKLQMQINPEKNNFITPHEVCDQVASKLPYITQNNESLHIDKDKGSYKAGEDSEAKVIFQGKDKSKSIESSVMKKSMSRKLPPLYKQKLIRRKVSFRKIVKPKPNMSLVFDLLSKEQGHNFDKISNDKGEIPIHNDTILSILNELREVKVNRLN